MLIPFFFQSVPTGVPALVTPNRAKVDLMTLKTDIPKYAAGGLGPITIQWWKAFVEMLETTMIPETEGPSSWLFSELVHLKRSCSLSTTVQRAPLPDQLSVMQQHENRSIPEVCTYPACEI